MRLRTFHAPNMKKAMEQIRDELGEDAIIISTNKDSLGKGVTVTAARGGKLDPDMEMLNERIAEENAFAARHALMPDYVVREIEKILLENGADSDVTDALLAEIRRFSAPDNIDKETIAKILAEAIRRIFEFRPIEYKKPSLRLILIGPPGTGKTLTTAKIAARIVKAGHKVTIITTDTKRAGGVQQIAGFANILGAKLHVAETRKELKEALAKCDKSDRVVVDSPGANPYDFYDLKELGEFAGLMELEPVLVFSGGGDPEEAREIAQAFSFLGVSRMLLSRIDLSRRFGSFLTAAYGTKTAFAQATGTEKVLGDWNDTTPDYLANILLSRTKI